MHKPDYLPEENCTNRNKCL